MIKYIFTSRFFNASKKEYHVFRREINGCNGMHAAFWEAAEADAAIIRKQPDMLFIELALEEIKESDKADTKLLEDDEHTTSGLLEEE